MASSRDDFIIAIRSAFLKKSTQQKFSLLTLVFISIFIILLSSLDFRIIRYMKMGINEVVYRSSFIVSIPENFVKNSFSKIIDYTTFYYKYQNTNEELENLRSKNISSEITQYENKELKELINDYVSSSDKILAKIIVDHKSTFLKSVIINKGSKDNIVIGTNIYDQSYLVGRVIEVNYKTSRVLLLSDLNSNVPVTIAPQNVQAIMSGTGGNTGQIKYIQNTLSSNFSNQSIVYTSGTGAIFKSGIPIGKIRISDEISNPKFNIEFYTDFSQLKYVFAEIITKEEIINLDDKKSNQDISGKKTTIDAKLKILEDEIKIIEESNGKFREENENFKNEIVSLQKKISELKSLNLSQKNSLKQFNIDLKELEFLRLNLEFGHKCRKSLLNPKGFISGSQDYKDCVLKKGGKF